MTRTVARDIAMRLLYKDEVGGEGGIDEICAMLECKPSARARAYIDGVLGGVSARQFSLDEIIEKHSDNWSIERIACVDKCILRLAMYEIMCMQDVPEEVAVNEAVKLAREYCGDESAAFINGVLGSAIRAGEFSAREEAGE